MSTHPVKEAVKIHMDTISAGGIKQDVFSVTITKTQDVAHHTHDGRSPGIRQPSVVPVQAWYKTLTHNFSEI